MEELVPLRNAEQIVARAFVIVTIGVLSACASGSTDSPEAATTQAEALVSAVETVDSSVEPPPDSSVRSSVDSSVDSVEDLRRPLCELLPQADVEAAFGETVTKNDGITCRYDTATGLKSVEVDRSYSEPEEWRSGFVDSDFWKPIDMGTEGWAGKGVPSIEFQFRDVQYEINVGWSTDGDPYAVAQKLASIVESNLP
jgi:hypothetical protein